MPSDAGGESVSFNYSGYGSYHSELGLSIVRMAFGHEAVFEAHGNQKRPGRLMW